MKVSNNYMIDFLSTKFDIIRQKSMEAFCVNRFKG